MPARALPKGLSSSCAQFFRLFSEKMIFRKQYNLIILELWCPVVTIRTDSGHYTYRQWSLYVPTVVTIRTDSLTCSNSTFSPPHSVFMCFVWISEQTAIISLYSVDWLVFITETECVYCAVRSTFYVLPTQCICVFCVDLRTNSDYFTVQH